MFDGKINVASKDGEFSPSHYSHVKEFATVFLIIKNHFSKSLKIFTLNNSTITHTINIKIKARLLILKHNVVEFNFTWKKKNSQIQ
jgi:hypothetical protein